MIAVLTVTSGLDTHIFNLSELYSNHLLYVEALIFMLFYSLIVGGINLYLSLLN